MCRIISVGSLWKGELDAGLHVCGVRLACECEILLSVGVEMKILRHNCPSVVLSVKSNAREIP